MERQLKGIQNSLERIDSARLVFLEQQLQKEYDDILFQEEVHRYQKSREKWVQLGDKNTRFFHAQTIIRRKRNKIHGLNLPSGIWCTDDTTLQEKAQKYFKSLFCDTQDTMPATMPTSNSPSLSQDSRDKLLLPVAMEEVITTLNQMHPYKSPGPDNFQGVFFRQYWEIIGKDIHSLIAQAFSTGDFNPSLADTLIALIPKVDCPTIAPLVYVTLCTSLSQRA